VNWRDELVRQVSEAHRFRIASRGQHPALARLNGRQAVATIACHAGQGISLSKRGMAAELMVASALHRQATARLTWIQARYPLEPTRCSDDSELTAGSECGA